MVLHFQFTVVSCNSLCFFSFCRFGHIWSVTGKCCFVLRFTNLQIEKEGCFIVLILVLLLCRCVETFKSSSLLLFSKFLPFLVLKYFDGHCSIVIIELQFLQFDVWGTTENRLRLFHSPDQSIKMLSSHL